MRIDLSSLPTTASRPSAQPAATALTQSWTVGQILDISVIEQLDPNTIRVAINGQPMVARSSLELPPGAQLTAKVLTAGLQPQLAIQPPPAAETEPAVVNTALGRALPQQAPLADVIPRLAQQLAHPASPSVLGHSVVRQLDTLMSSLPNLRALTQPGPLAAAVRLAGNRLERSLGEVATRAPAQTPAPAIAGPVALPDGDLKLQLVALREALLTAVQRPEAAALASPRLPAPPIDPGTAPRTPLPGPAPNDGAMSSAARGGDLAPANVARSPTTPLPAPLSAALPEQSPAADEPEPPLRPSGSQIPAAPSASGLLDDVNAALARITTHQLDSANAAQNQALVACYELPVKTPNGIQTLTIEVQDEGRRAAGTAPAALAVMVEVPVGELGKLRARIGLAGDRIAISTWSDTPALRELILAHINELDTALAAKGFDVAPSVVRELPPARAVHGHEQHLIDTEI